MTGINICQGNLVFRLFICPETTLSSRLYLGIDDSDLGSFYSLKCLYDQGLRGIAASGAVFSIFFCYHEPALGQIDKDHRVLCQ